MTRLSATAKGYRASKRILKNLHESFDDVLEQSLDKVIEKIGADADSELQNKQHVVTGQTLASKRITKEKRSRTISYGAGGYYIEHGRGLVLPKTAKMLHWIDPDTGEDVFATHSDPVDPDPFLEPAVNRNKKGLSDLISEGSVKIIRREKNAG